MATKLLLADDSITIHKVVGLTFADEDVEIEAVTNGNVALEKVRAGKPDIVLADVFMPGRNGYEVCDSIKSDPELGRTPVVLLVGTFEPFDEDEAARVRCDAHITKPFDTAELVKLIHDLVARQEPKVEEMASAPPSEPRELSAAAAQADAGIRLTGLISPRTRESFLGEKHILDIFDTPLSEVRGGGETAKADERPATGQGQEPPAAPPSPVIPFPGTSRASESVTPPIHVPQETIDLIVEKVVKRMSDDVVRDVAWEVVPALSEIMIRQYLDELRADKKS